MSLHRGIRLKLTLLRVTADEHVPHPHPAAPPKVVESFSHFQEVFESGPHFNPEKLKAASSPSSETQSSSGSGLIQVDMTGREVAEDVHLLPERFWKTPALMFSDEEMEAVMVSLHSPTTSPL